MSDLDVVYKISADITGLQSGVDRAAKSTERLGSFASELGKAMAGAFTLHEVVEFGNHVLDVADKVQKMSDQTGLATDEVQRLQYIAGQSGTGVDSLVNAVQTLQQRLGDHNEGTVGAIGRLNINLASFQKLGAYEQMTTLADGIKAIKDPTEQASTAAAIFGKNWKEILPAIKSGMKEVGDQAPIMADETIKSLDRVGDALKRSEQTATAWAGNLVLELEGAGFAVGDFLSTFNPSHFGVATSEILKLAGAANDPDGLKGALQAATTEASKLTSAGIEPLKKILGPTAAEMVTLNAETERNVERTKKAGEETQRLIAEEKKFTDSVTDATLAMNLSTFTLNRYGAVALPAVQTGLKGVETEFHTLASSTLPQFGLTIDQVGQRSSIAFVDLRTHAQKFNDELSAHLQDLTTGFALLAQISGKSFDGLEQEIGQIIAALNLAKVAADAFGIAISAAAAGGVGGVLSLIGHFTTLQAKQDQERKALDDLKVRAASTFEAGIKALGAYADGFIRAINNARTLAEVQQAIQNLTDAIDYQKSAMETLDETVKKYGFSLEQLGPALQRQNLDQRAQELYKDFQVLTNAGIDYHAVLEKMGGSINEFVHDALKTGVEVPAAMKPMIEKMIEMGTLTDDAGNLITDISQIPFAKTMTQGFESVVEEVKKLTDAIVRGLGLAIDNLPKDIHIKGTIEYETTEVGGGINQDQNHVGGVGPIEGAAGGGRVREWGIQHFKRGGPVLPSLFVPQGTDTVPAMLTPGEMVLNRQQQRDWLGRDGVQVGSIAVHMTVAENVDRKRLAENFKEVLRTDATVYEAVGVVAKRVVAAR